MHHTGTLLRPATPRDRLQRRYQSLRAGVEKEFVFPNRIALPEIDHVSESHFGYIAAGDLLQVLADDDGNLMSTVFYENYGTFKVSRIRSISRSPPR